MRCPATRHLTALFLLCIAPALAAVPNVQTTPGTNLTAASPSFEPGPAMRGAGRPACQDQQTDRFLVYLRHAQDKMGGDLDNLQKRLVVVENGTLSTVDSDRVIAEQQIVRLNGAISAVSVARDQALAQVELIQKLKRC